MVKDRRSVSSPVSHLEPLNPPIDRRYECRALNEPELRKLMRAASEGRELIGVDRHRVVAWRLSGWDRSILYRLAVETGLRASEIRSLTPESFDLNPSLPTVKVLAAYSKHRRDDTLPLRSSTAGTLGTYLKVRVPAKPIFSLPRRDKLANILRVDLAAAGIPVSDAQGRVVDFHALRHTFITNLAQGGVHPKTAQALARHSTITLTMDRYSHVGRDQEVEALRVLPDLSDDLEDKPTTNARDNVRPLAGTETIPNVSAVCLARIERPRASEGDSEILRTPETRPCKEARYPEENRKKQVAPVGFEPTRPDEGLRILSPLRLPFRHRAALAHSIGATVHGSAFRLRLLRWS